MRKEKRRAMPGLRLDDSLRSRRAEGYIETAVGVFVALLLVVFSLNVFHLFTVRSDLDLYAKQVLETACACGSTGEETERRIEELERKTGLSPEVSFEGTEYLNAGRPAVQYGDEVSVTLTLRTSLQGFGLFSVPVTLQAYATGLSRRYWK